MKFLDFLNPNWWSVFLTTFLSEDLALVTGLSHLALGSLQRESMVLAWVFGVFVGDAAVYALGYLLRTRRDFIEAVVLKFFPSVPIPQKALSSAFFDRLLIFTRFIPGTRFPSFVAAGFSGYSFFRFLTLLTTVSLIYVYFVIGIRSIIRLDTSHSIGASIFVSVFCIGFSLAILKIALFLIQNKDRLPLAIKIKRLGFRKYFRAEFLPSTIVYLPVFFYWLYLAAKTRSVFGWLYVNPKIENSGFIGESKVALEELVRSQLPENSLKHLFLPRGLAVPQLELRLKMFVDQVGFPFYLKPNKGQKGHGVKRVNSYNEAIEHFIACDQDFMAQEFCNYQHEWGILITRSPNKPWRVFSITIKTLPEIVGDGSSTVQDLILAHPRYQLLSDVLFQKTRMHLSTILGKDERLLLVHTGNHTQGALFEDGQKYITDELDSVLNKAFRDFPGINFLRADIKIRTVEDLLNGKFKIIELNGAGGESTNIYDPQTNILKIYTVLFKQWKKIFEIGRENMDLICPTIGERVLLCRNFFKDLARTLILFQRIREKSYLKNLNEAEAATREAPL